VAAAAAAAVEVAVVDHVVAKQKEIDENISKNPLIDENINITCRPIILVYSAARD
jgi:hypothetical protein